MDENNLENIYHLFSQVIKLRVCKMRSMFESVGIYPGQQTLLFALKKEEGKSQKEIAQIMNIKPATMTVMINRMEKSRLLERRQDEKDQRISRVYLTSNGKNACNKVKEIMKTIDEESFKDFTEEQQNMLIELLTQIEKNLAFPSDTSEQCFCK
jgi:DNA-binding MarR family transcriptional regulator